MEENLSQNTVPRARKSTKLRTLDLKSYSMLESNEAVEEYSDPDLSSSESEEVVVTEPTEDFIYRKCLRDEKNIPVSASKMTEMNGPDVSDWRQRSIRRIAKFHYFFRMSTDAFFNAITYFDIYISKTRVDPEELDLLIVSCYILAVKFDHRSQIVPDQINKLLQTNYTKSDFGAMEMKLVSTLDFNLSFPTAHMFMNRFVTRVRASPETKEIASVLIEIAVMLFQFVDVVPSVLAASAVAVSCAVIGDKKAAKKAVAELGLSNEEKAKMKKTITEFIGFTKDIVSSRAKIGADSPVQKLISAMNFEFSVDDIL